MMQTLRSWKREGRLLAIIAEFSATGGPSFEQVVLTDFLLQHPSLLADIARDLGRSLPDEAEAREVEIDSSEEALLAWKRAVGARPLLPMLGRLIARGLIRARLPEGFALTPRGEEIAASLSRLPGSSERSRLATVSSWTENDEESLRARLRALLAGRGV
jgi:hypothetical protein